MVGINSRGKFYHILVTSLAECVQNEDRSQVKKFYFLKIEYSFVIFFVAVKAIDRFLYSKIFYYSVLALLCFISLFSMTKQEIFDGSCAKYNVQPMTGFKKRIVNQ